MAIDLNDQGGPAPGLEHPALRWLTSQRELLIHGAVIRWQDELRQAPEPTLRDVEFLARNGRLSHRFALRASAGERLARQLDLRAEFNRGLFSGDAGNPANWSGQLYLQADDLEPLAWSAWLPALPVAGRLSGRAWLQLDHGKFTELTSDLAVRGLSWAARPEGPSCAASTRSSACRGCRVISSRPTAGPGPQPGRA